MMVNLQLHQMQKNEEGLNQKCQDQVMNLIYLANFQQMTQNSYQKAPRSLNYLKFLQQLFHQFQLPPPAYSAFLHLQDAFFQQGILKLNQKQYFSPRHFEAIYAAKVLQNLDANQGPFLSIKKEIRSFLQTKHQGQLKLENLYTEFEIKLSQVVYQQVEACIQQVQ